MKTKDLHEAIERAKGGLLAGEDPDEVLTNFAAAVNGCGSCGSDNLCFKCKLTEVLGERVTLAMPLLLPKLAGMVKEWYAERQAPEAGKTRKWEPGRGEQF